MAAKIFRINYKSDFILTMNSEAGWTIPFCIKFWTSIPMRAYYVGFDGTTYTHCAYDPAEPTKLLVQFDDHHLPIGNLHFQIAYHFTVEDFPNNTEDEVFNATAITTEIDGETYQVMLDFTGETAPGIDFNMPSVGVTSVNGKIGAVTLNAQDVGAQPTIEDLATIRSGAAEGATAVQPAEMTAALATKQDTIPDLANIRSGAAAGATAVQPAALQEGLATKQNVITDLSTIRSGAAAGATAVQPAAITPIQTALQTIEAVIPSAASSQNQLADKNFVNSSIATNTANFVGTYNSLAELQAVQNPTNNDYGFVIETDAQGNEYYDRYKYVAASQQWLFEYKVESTPFTAAQWAAIQSGITSALVTKLNALPTAQQLSNQLAAKQDTISDLATIRSGAAAGAEAAVRPYNTQSPDGMGYLVLDKDATFASQVTTANTIYEIRYDYDLNGQTVTLPTNCVLNFNGGSVKNGDLVGNVSCISSDKTTIFDDVTISGTWNNSVSYAEWFNFDGVDDSKNVQNLFNFRGNIELQANVVYVIKSILFPNSSTNVKGSLRLWSNSFLEGNGATLKLADNVLADKNTNMITPEDNINNLTINNVIFDGNSANNIFDFSTSRVARTAMFIRFGGANNVVITNSKFLNCAGRNDIVVSMTWSDDTNHNDAGDNIHIKDCVFRSGGAYISNGQLNANQNDFSFILSEASHTIVEGCFFVECDLDTTDVIGGVDYDTRKSYNINCGGYELHGDFSSSLNNTFIGCRPAIFICTQKEHELKNLVVCGNFIDCKDGINFYNIRDGSYNNCDISQNVIKATTFGIYAGLNGSYNVPIKNVKIRNNSIYSNISLQFNEINDSEISFNNITADYVGIFLYGAQMEQENLTINNNMITILNANISHTSSGAYTIEKAGIYKREIPHLEAGGYYPLYNFNVVDNKFIFVNSEDSEGDSVGTGISMLDHFSNVARHFNTKAVTITGNSVLNGDVSDNTIRSAALKSYFDINYTNNSRMEIRYHVGTFADKPTVKNIYEGYRYFCTDKQTTEGATNGIDITYKGLDVWVDALGRVVS